MAIDPPKPNTIDFGFAGEFEDLSFIQPQSLATPTVDNPPAVKSALQKGSERGEGENIFDEGLVFERAAPQQPAAKTLVEKKASPQTSKLVAAKKTNVKSAPAKRALKTSHKRSEQDAQDELARSLGFASRDANPVPVLKKRRRLQHDEPVDQLSIRGPVRILNAFITHCDQEGVSYWEGLETLLNRST